MKKLLYLLLTLVMVGLSGFFVPANNVNAADNITSDRGLYSLTSADKLVEIGNIAKSGTFKPDIKFSRWYGEAAITLSLVTADSFTSSLDTSKVSAASPSYNIEYSPVSTKAGFNDCLGYDIVIALDKIPASNKFTFTSILANVQADFQPPLTAIYTSGYSNEFKTDIDVTETQVKARATGDILVNRPDYVVNSIAFYSTNKRNNDYKTGKVGHLYRMQAVDSKGNKAWADWANDNGYFNLTVDSKWLANAVYPVKIQPVGDTFGYTSAGASSTQYGAGYNPRGSVANTYTASTGDTITSYSAYWSTAGDSLRTFHASAYTVSGGDLVTRVAAAHDDATLTSAELTGGKWFTSNTVSHALSNGTTYGIAMDFNETSYSANFFYDSATGGAKRYDGALDLPATWTTAASYDYRFSWYATYTAGGGGAPAAPTNVSATDGSETSKVVITWTKSVGATNYTIWRDSTNVTSVGDVATYDDTGAAAGTITAGNAAATDGTSTAQISLTISGCSSANGTSYTYKVQAYNEYGLSANSTGDAGYRGIGSLTYQWKRSSGTTDGSYSDLTGATSASYDDTTAPAGTVTPGAAAATDGDFSSKVTASISGAAANNGAVRWYYCVVSATGATSQDTGHNDGYRSVGSLTYQWMKSAGDSDGTYSDIGGATTAPYDDSAAPAPTITGGSVVAGDGTSPLQVACSLSGASANNGAGRYWLCTVSATGAASANTTADRGYTAPGALTYQWYRSAADADAAYSNIGGATSATYNDTAAPAPSLTAGNATASDGTSGTYVTLTVSGQSASNGDGRYWVCQLSAAGATSQNATANRGYRGTTTLTFAWWRSAADADAAFSAIAGGTTNPYNDTGGVVTPDGRYYYAVVSMSGATSANTTHDRGYKSIIVAPLGPPLNFTVTDTGGISVSANWTLGTSAVNTMVRMSRTAYPTSPTAGEQVYFSNGTATTQTGLNLDTTEYYYSAWSEDGAGTYSTEYATDSAGGEGMTAFTTAFNNFLQIALVLALLTIALFYSKRDPLGFFLLLITAFVAWFVGINYQSTSFTVGVSIMTVAPFCFVMAIYRIFSGKGETKEE